jgi:hypothetical protein
MSYTPSTRDAGHTCLPVTVQQIPSAAPTVTDADALFPLSVPAATSPSSSLSPAKAKAARAGVSSSHMGMTSPQTKSLPDAAARGDAAGAAPPPPSPAPTSASSSVTSPTFAQRYPALDLAQVLHCCVLCLCISHRSPWRRVCFRPRFSGSSATTMASVTLPPLSTSSTQPSQAPVVSSPKVWPLCGRALVRLTLRTRVLTHAGFCCAS